MAHGSRGEQATAAPPHAHASNGVLTSTPTTGAAKVNQKKAKRRAKEAAKKQAQAQAPGGDSNVQHNLSPQSAAHVSNQMASQQHGQEPLEYENGYDGQDSYDQDEYYSEEDVAYHGQYDPAYPTGSHPAMAGMNGAGKKNKKKKKKQDPYSLPPSGHGYPTSHLPPPPPSTLTARVQHHAGGDHIWNTSTQQERERIKDFWLQLKEDERRSLVKVEKEAVLKKMKEQQKHSCSCTVCGRKRTAIEEELEVLYDAYYDELEQYAETGVLWANLPKIPSLPNPKEPTHQHDSRLPPDRMPDLIQPHPRRQIIEVSSDDDEAYEEEDYTDDDDYDDDEDYSDDERLDMSRGPRDFFSFGASLQVKGGILTVADDLLKNDGKKFIEMMEQLAERRMQREEEAQYAAVTHPNSYYERGHGHGAPEDEDDDDFDDEDDYDSQDDFEEEEEDMETMTEEQRMQEGRRMFQIFAARMFEQRVLTAYREKVAAERQNALMEELDAENAGNAAREAKRAKDAEKRKAKKQQQKQKQQEEKARKDAEKAEKERAAKEEQERKLEEQKKRREEQRIKKEEQRKALEVEAARKQAEKLKRQKEEQDRRQEAERKAREQKEAERKVREEAKKKEREERDARDREAKERKAKADLERKENEGKQKAEQDRLRKETQAVQQAQAVQAAKRAVAPPAVPIPPGLTKQPSNFASPHVQPAIPKAPTPSRPRQGSQQGSKGSSPKTPAIAAGQPKAGSPGIMGGAPTHPQNPPVPKILSRPTNQPPVSNVQQPNFTSPSGIAPPPGMPIPPGAGYGVPPPQSGFPHAPSPMTPNPINGMTRTPMTQNVFSPPQQPHQPFPGSFPSAVGSQNNGFAPPGLGAPGMPQFNRGFPEGPYFHSGFMRPPNPAGTASYGVFPDTMPARPMPGQHSRQQSGSSTNVDQPPIGAGVAPGVRSHPVGQSANKLQSSINEVKKYTAVPDEIDELAGILGSSALLDDSDSDGLKSDGKPLRYADTSPSEHSNSFNAFGQGPRGSSFGIGAPISGMPGTGGQWGTPSMPFGGTPSLGGAAWGSSPTSPWPSTLNSVWNPNPAINPNQPAHFVPRDVYATSAQPRPHQTRARIVDCYKMISSRTGSRPDGFVEAKRIHEDIQYMANPPTTEAELRALLETEGTSQNGGGFFQLQRTGDGDLDVLVKWVPDDRQGHGPAGHIGGAGEIGSPVIGASHPVGSANTTPYGSVRGGLPFQGLAGLGQGLGN